MLSEGAPSLLFCSSCGGYATICPGARGLRAYCLGKRAALAGAGKKNKGSFARGRHPNRAHRLGPWLSPGALARELFGGSFEEPGAQPDGARSVAPPARPVRHDLCLSDCLQAFGLNEAEARGLGKRLKEKQQDVLPEEFEDGELFS